jgi:Zn-dependent peptidase ImmA (M78 family)
MAVIRKQVPANATPHRDVVTSLDSLRQRLEAAGLTSIPMNINAVAEFLGLDVIEEIMDDDLSGYLEFRQGAWVAGVNALHHKNRRRFTIAHEIAHYVLHRDRAVSFHDRTFARRASSTDEMEKEADRFAANLLMPENSVRQSIKNGATSVTALAEIFGVSALAMKYRVQSLGYQVA